MVLGALDLVGVVLAVLCFPFALLALVMLMAQLEERMVRPDERAATIVALIVTEENPDSVELGVQAIAKSALAEQPTAAGPAA